MDHMEDPLSPNARIKSEDDFQQYKTLSSRVFGTDCYEEYCNRARRAASEVQSAPLGTWRYIGITGKARRAIKRLVGTGRVTRFQR
jgi:hypothetical protein